MSLIVTYIFTTDLIMCINVSLSYENIILTDPLRLFKTGLLKDQTYI